MQGFCESYEIWQLDWTCVPPLSPPSPVLFACLLALAKTRYCVSKIEVCELRKLNLFSGGISGPLS